MFSYQVMEAFLSTSQYEHISDNQNRYLECIYRQPSCFPTEAIVKGFINFYVIPPIAA